MALSITHQFVSAIPDGGDATIVQPSNWNATHSISGTLSGASLDLTVGTTTVGSGTTGKLLFDNAGVLGESVWKDSSGNLIATTDNTYDIGASGANRPRSGYFGGGLQVGTATIAGVSNVLIGVDSTRYISTSGGSFLQFGVGCEINVSNGYFITASGGQIGFTSAGVGGASNDVYLSRDAANALALRNSTNAQDFRVYSTFTDASNYERLSINFNTLPGLYGISTQGAGTGSVRGIVLEGSTVSLRAGGNYFLVINGGATGTWNIVNAGHLQAGTDNTYDIGASGANRPRNLYIAGDFALNSTITAGSNLSFQCGSNSILIGGSTASVQFFNTPIWCRGNGFSLFMASGNQLGWGSTSDNTGTNDLILIRAAAATLQFGAADANPPVAQLTQVQSASGSNISGANWTLIGSLSTGSGTSGDIIFQTGGTGAGASSKNTATTALTVKGATQQVIMAVKPRINVTPTAVGTGTKTISNGADSSTNFGHYVAINMNGTDYYFPCSSVAPT